MARVQLQGSERVPHAGAKVVAPAHPNVRLEVTVMLRRRTPLVAAPGEAPIAERRHLEHADFESTYGADPADQARVAAFAAEHGLVVVKVALARRLVVLGGAVAACERAFSTRLMHYQHADGDFIGRVGPLSIPAELAGVVTGVFGLDTRRLARVRPRPRPRGMTRGAGAGAGRPGVSAVDLAKYYEFPEGDGKGQCVGLLEFGGGYSEDDLRSYCQQLGLTAPEVVQVGVDGTRPDYGSADATGEVELDIEVVAALVPGARLAVYFCDFTEKGWVDVLSAAIHDRDNKPSVLSISWGFAEGHYIWTTAVIDAVNEILQEAAALGITVCVASGDDGSEDDVTDGYAHVDFPASSPYVLAVGGTSLVSQGGSVAGETVWNDGPRATRGGAGGGGISTVFPLPAWQANAGVPVSATPPHAQGRGVPDVAAFADPVPGYFVVVEGSAACVGGTSAAAPLWAALVARINQSLGKSVGFINPLLYGPLAGKVCSGITTGNNDPTGQIGGYAAGPGWNACTGWGSPRGQALLDALRSQPAAAAPSESPTATATDTGHRVAAS